MGQTLREKVMWFCRNIDLQIDDLALEQSGISLDVYFDTHDILTTIQGLGAFYKHERFNLHRVFREDERHPFQDPILVQCLLMSGRLGAIDMLQPHQAELRNKLEGLDETRLRVGPKQIVRQFLQEVYLTGAVRYEPVSLESLSNGELLEYVRRYVGSTVNLFKTTQLINSGAWGQRLERLRSENFLHFNSESVDWDSMIRSNTFIKLKTLLDEKRPALPINNFADAAAVSMLIAHLEEFKTQRSKRIPRFFIYSALLLRTIEEAGVEEELSYTTHIGTTASILRGADYFVFKAIFHPSPTESHSEDLKGALDNLSNLSKSLHQALETTEPITFEHLDMIAVSGRPLGNVIDDLSQLLFFENVWLQSSAVKDEEALFLELHEAVDMLKSETFKRSVDEAIEATIHDLEMNVAEYQRISVLWGQVERAILLFRDRVQKRKLMDLDFFRDFGLLRFAFPLSTQKKITDLLDALLSNDEERSIYPRIDVVTTFHKVPENSVKYFDDLAATACLLWIGRKYEDLIALLESINPLPHYCFKMILAAATFVSQKKIEVGDTVLEEIEQTYSTTNDKQEKADLAVGSAYLLFHLAGCRGYVPTWRGHQHQATSVIGQALIDRAIKRAKEAYQLTGDWDLQKKAYALNQFLYYLVEGGDDERRPDMNEAAAELIRYRAESAYELWQYRFDDTLARYFHRLALWAPDPEGRNRLMKEALRYIEQAWEVAPWDNEIDIYRSELLIKKYA